MIRYLARFSTLLTLPAPIMIGVLLSVAFLTKGGLALEAVAGMVVFHVCFVVAREIVTHFAADRVAANAPPTSPPARRSARAEYGRMRRLVRIVKRPAHRPASQSVTSRIAS